MPTQQERDDFERAQEAEREVGGIPEYVGESDDD